MFHRLRLAVLLMGFLVVPANSQTKDAPKPTSLLTWETVAADPGGTMVTKRASVPGGWLVLVQRGDSTSLTFFPDEKHRWNEGSPSDRRPKGKDRRKPEEDITKSTLEKLKADVEQARATALAERDKAHAALKKAEEERKKLLDDLDKDRKSKKEAARGTAAAELEAAMKEALKQREIAEV